MPSDENIESIRDNLSRLKEENLTDDGLIHSDHLLLMTHNQKFTELLSCYVENYEASWASKQSLRKWMFHICIGLLVFITTASTGIIIWSACYVHITKGDLLAVIPAVVGAMVSLVSGFMTIPNIIAGYLYNADEEKHLSDIIGKIQEYDAKIRMGKIEEG